MVIDVRIKKIGHKNVIPMFRLFKGDIGLILFDRYGRVGYCLFRLLAAADLLKRQNTTLRCSLKVAIRRRPRNAIVIVNDLHNASQPDDNTIV